MHAPRVVCMVTFTYVKARSFLNRLLKYAFHEYVRGSILSMSILDVSCLFGFACQFIIEMSRVGGQPY